MKSSGRSEGPPKKKERVEKERDRQHALKVVDIWNSRAQRRACPSFYPTIASCVVAERPWLQWECLGCQQIGEVDLRTVDRHPDASISSLVTVLALRTIGAVRQTGWAQ